MAIYKSLILSLIVAVMLALHPVPAGAAGLFSKGINLSGWFQAGSAREIHFTKYTKKDLREIKSLGCDVIRLPINLHGMTSGAPEYTIDPLFFLFLDSVVDQCEELGLALILDNHTFDPAVKTKPSVEKVLLKVWVQMAEHYKDRGDFLYYEILNEPHGLSPNVWGRIQSNVIKGIREYDQKHWVIVGGANWNDIDSLDLLPDMKDDKLIYTFHFYDPFFFTHQGADWTNPPLTSLKNMPYPYDQQRMPPLPKELAGTWVRESFRSGYPKEANDQALEKRIAKAAEFGRKTGKPVFCGEFGVFMPYSQNEDRVYWYKSVREIFEKYSIPWTSWDYRGGFGLFNKDSNELFEQDLNLPLLRALGLNEVSQKEFILQPETDGFALFNQFPAQGLDLYDYLTRGSIDLYDATAFDDEQRFAIKMENIAHYNYLRFGFKPVKDLSFLVEKQYNLEIKLKLLPNFKNAEIRFLAVREDDPLALPWRMGFTLDEKILTKTTDWQRVTIPLSNFTELGAWKEKWYDPMGLFDWSRVAAFEIVAEKEDWRNTGMYIGELIIVAEGPAE